MAPRLNAKNLMKLYNQNNRNLLFGMVHLRALPGAPRADLPLPEIERIAINEARLLASHGVDGIIIENMHDVPYLRPDEMHGDGASTAVYMTILCSSIQKACRHINPSLLYGVQILAAANRQAMSVAAANEFDFIRAEAFAYAHVADEGIMQSTAAKVLRHRKKLNAQVSIIADVKKKHRRGQSFSHAITGDLSSVEVAMGAQFNGADGVIITGIHTGQSADLEQLEELRKAIPDLPVWIGSGITAENIHEYNNAQALIVGSYFKHDGHWANDIDDVRLAQLIDAHRSSYTKQY